MVLNNRFIPNDLTIEVGDTVRWTNSAGFHDATADDGSWRSKTSSSFVFEQTFSSVEEVRYYCTVHSAPGRNIMASMNGRINVVDAGETDFTINPALSDAWFHTAMLDVFLTEGGVFDAAEPAPADAVQVGTISITWSGCNAGTLTYDLPGVSRAGSIPIERIVLDNVAACEASQTSP